MDKRSSIRCALSSSENPKSKIQNLKLGGVLALGITIWGGVAQAQQAKIYRIGVIHQGGPYTAVVDGLRDGLKQLGLEEGKRFVLDIRETKGDIKAVEEAAKKFEHEKINLIYAVVSSVVTAVKSVTSQVPIVFAVGSDPVASGLVQSYVKPGGRLTGVHFSTTDLTGKRLEILKEMLPKLGKIIIIYNPTNRFAVEAARLARQAGKQLGVQVAERQVNAVEELRQALGALKAKEADAFFYISDSMVMSQAQFVVNTTTAKKLPTMFSEQNLVTMGGLASYGQNFYETGRLSAKYVQKIMSGAQPGDLRVEVVDRFELIINLKTAKEIGLTIPPNLLVRADKVIR
jgi:putative ABC transport system substrate-binding protein